MTKDLTDMQMVAIYTGIAARLEKEYLTEELDRGEIRNLIHNASINQIVGAEAVKRVLKEAGVDDVEAYTERYKALMSQLSTEVLESAIDLVEFSNEVNKR